ncbi:MAG: ferritin family protein [bacterium]|nr:ferritin family protein [bacterium]MDT8365154.1 ferritin family protein [bacterium]
MERKAAYGPYEAVTLGIQLEDDGFTFYSAVAGASVDHRVKDLFSYLADAEIEHKRVIREEIAPLFKPEWYKEEDQQQLAEYLKDVEQQPVFPEPDKAVEFAKSMKDAHRAVDIGILAEERARDYFAFLRDTTRDQEGKDIFQRLHLEEIKHLELLLNLRKEL